MEDPVVISWSEEDQAYVADAPDLRSCSAHGETPEEAPREMSVAMGAWLAAARERGIALPEQSRRFAAVG